MFLAIHQREFFRGRPLQKECLFPGETFSDDFDLAYLGQLPGIIWITFSTISDSLERRNDWNIEIDVTALTDAREDYFKRPY